MLAKPTIESRDIEDNEPWPEPDVRHLSPMDHRPQRSNLDPDVRRCS